MKMQNPLNPLIDEAEDILGALKSAVDRLEQAINTESIMRARAKDAEESLNVDIDEALMGEIVLKEGTFSLAPSSDAYKLAMKVRAASLRTSEQFAGQYIAAKRARTEADNARSEMEQAQAAFSAVKHAADLKAMILRASVL